MAEDYFNAFDYYNADPPREGSVPPPDEAAAAAPEDEYNEKVHESVSTGRPAGTVRSVALALAVGGIAVSFMISSGGILPYAGSVPAVSTAVETSVSESSGGKPSGQVTETSAEPTPTPMPTPTPAPTPTPVPLPTEDLGVKIDSFKMYPLDKGFLAEVKFTLATNCGIDVTSITGTLDAKQKKVTGYNVKKRKFKFKTVNVHKTFSMDSSKVTVGDGADLTEKQYTLMFKVAIDADSEDKFTVKLTVSNTLNGAPTEDKVATLKNVKIWNTKTDNYSATMFTISTTKNSNKSFDVTVTSKEGFNVTDASVTGVRLYGKKNSTFLDVNAFKTSSSGNKVHITAKKPKKVPSKGTIYFYVFAKYEVTDSTGTTYTGKCFFPGRKSY